ncbi:MAG TPA: LEA type 2 family protein [Longimicrobiales bacterium]
MKRIIIAVVLAAGVTACSSAFRGVFEEPTVRLDGIQVNGLGLTGGSLIARFEIENPNSFGLETDRVDYTVEILDRTRSDSTWMPLTKGVIDDNIRVGGNERKTLELPIEFSFRDFGPAFRAILDRGTVTYRVTGEVAVEEPLRRTVKFRKQDVASLATIR